MIVVRIKATIGPPNNFMDSEKRAWLYGFIVVLAWSSVATVFKLTLQWLSPVAMVALAGIFSWLGLALLATALNLWHQLWHIGPRSWMLAIVLGLINPLLYYVILFSAYNLIPAQLAQSINYTWPIILTILAVPILKQRLTLLQILALCLGYLGVLIVTVGGYEMAPTLIDIRGIILAFLSTIIWAIYWIFYTKSRVHSIVLLLASFSASLPILICMVLLTTDFVVPPWQGLLGAAYIGLFEMGLTFALWGTALRLTKYAGKLAQLVFLSPFLSLLWITMVLGEDILLTTYVGMVLIVAAVLIQQRLR